MTKHVDYTSKEFWKPLGRVAIFIEAANVFYSQKTMGWSFDFRRFYPFFVLMCEEFVGASFYFALWFEMGNKKRKNEEKLISMLKREGFRVVVKDSKRVGSNVKANCDVELTIDAVALANSYDTFVLFSGDGDFTPLCKYLKRQGKRTVVSSYRGHISSELIESADFYIPFNKIRTELEYLGNLGKIKKDPGGSF